MNLSELTATVYLAANDYEDGHVFPCLQIVKITIEEVPTPGRKEKTKKGVIYLQQAPKGWVANKTELRKLAQIYGASKAIEKAWIGHWIQLHVVSGIRRPDGTHGNAFRVKAAFKDGEQPKQQAQA